MTDAPSTVPPKRRRPWLGVAAVFGLYAVAAIAASEYERRCGSALSDGVMADPFPPAPAPAESRKVLVVDDRGRPVSGAAVRFVRKACFERLPTDGVEAAVGHGEFAPTPLEFDRSIAATDGFAAAPWSEGDLLAFASHGGESGVASLSGTAQGPLTVTLGPQRSIRVKVVDAAGDPVPDALLVLERTTPAGLVLFRVTGRADAHGAAEWKAPYPHDARDRVFVPSFDGVDHSTAVGDEAASIVMPDFVRREFRMVLPHASPSRIKMRIADVDAAVWEFEASDGDVWGAAGGPGPASFEFAGDDGSWGIMSVSFGVSSRRTSKHVASLNGGRSEMRFKPPNGSKPGIYAVAVNGLAASGDFLGPWLRREVASTDAAPIACELPRRALIGLNGVHAFVVKTAGAAGSRPYSALVGSGASSGNALPERLEITWSSPLSIAFCVDVLDGRGRAAAGIDLELVTDVDFIVRRENGAFDPAEPSQSATLRTDARGRFVGYAARSPGFLRATWSRRSDDGGTTSSGSTTFSGGSFTYVPLNVR